MLLSLFLSLVASGRPLLEGERGRFHSEKESSTMAKDSFLFHNKAKSLWLYCPNMWVIWGSLVSDESVYLSVFGCYGGTCEVYAN